MMNMQVRVIMSLLFRPEAKRVILKNCLVTFYGALTGQIYYMREINVLSLQVLKKIGKPFI